MQYILINKNTEQFYGWSDRWVSEYPDARKFDKEEIVYLRENHPDPDAANARAVSVEDYKAGKVYKGQKF